MRLHVTLGRLTSLASMVMAALLLCGCESLFSSGKPQPQLPQGDATGTTIPLKRGDHVRIDMVVGGGGTTIPFREEQVKEDGTINVQLLPPVMVLNKSCRDVEKEIMNLYITNKIYNSITVTVTPLDRYYYVGGEVVHPGEQRYNGAITVTKAIQAAADFTEFANRRKIFLFRPTGSNKVEKVTVNYYRLLDHPEEDPAVYPGDKIDVRRRRW